MKFGWSDTGRRPTVRHRRATYVDPGRRSILMRLAVFGASGGTGREVVQQALAAGHDVTAMIRNAGAALPEANGRLRVVVGDFSRQETVQQVVSGQDAVISALGTNEKGPVSVCTDGVQAILRAM